MKSTLKMLAAVVGAAVLLFIVTVVATAAYVYVRQDPQQLYRAIERADAMTITKHNIDNRVLYRTTDGAQIASFEKAAAAHRHFTLTLPSCRGDFGINFYRNGHQIAALAYLPNGNLREDLIEHAGYLIVNDKQALRRWIDKRIGKR